MPRDYFEGINNSKNNYIDPRGRITLCSRCKSIRRAFKSECPDCGNPILLVWIRDDDFYDYLSLHGLRDLVIKDQKIIEYILNNFKVKEN